MLQMMQKKVTEQGEKEQELFDKFMCYCKNGAAALEKSIEEAKTKIPQVESDLKSGSAEKAQLESDIKQAKTDSAAAKTTMAEATAIREKTAAAFAKEAAEQKADSAAMGKAITSISKGMSGFLQTPAATVLRRLVVSTDLSLESRDMLTSFLSTGSSDEDEDSAPGSGEIVGLLKQMKETMDKDVATAASAESASITDYDALMAAKGKESDALTKEIETKIARVGETGVTLVNDAEDLESTNKQLAEDEKFLGGLGSSCKTKASEWEATQKARGEELTALADTIKLLNDDDALDLFKKTLPSASFLQLKITSKDTLKRARKALGSLRVRDYKLDLISIAMQGKAVDFAKVTAMIDDMTALLKKEQVDDDKKKVYCEESFDKAEDEMKELSRSENDLKKTIADEKEIIATLTEEIASLEEGIKALDKSVAEATEQRKKENAVYTEDLAANNAAVEIIGLAKNRMNKFYNPKLYKAAPKRQLSEEDQITVNMGGTVAPTAAPGGIAGTGITGLVEEDSEEPSFVQVSAHRHGRRGAPPPPPETAGAFKKKSGDSAGVIEMMDILIRDVKKEVEEMKFAEKDAQAEYETLLADSSEKRATDAKAVAEKEAAKADTASKQQKHEEELKATIGELYANGEYTQNLHKECDWLLQNFDTRKSARASEVDALSKAKAVLNGADYSF
jgi:hypothetical protein